MPAVGGRTLPIIQGAAAVVRLAKTLPETRDLVVLVAQL